MQGRQNMKMSFVFGWVLAIGMAFASEVPTITINASGSAKIAPTALQIWITVKEKGADAAAALEALKVSKEKIAAKLASLGSKTELKCDLPVVLDKAAQEAMRARRTCRRLKRQP